MFDQFVKNISGKEVYLLFSLWMFLVFFIVVALLLLKMRKQHAEYMSDIPLNDCSIPTSNTLES
jgi:cbb3-type cytochrome oxidase subunit 3